METTAKIIGYVLMTATAVALLLAALSWFLSELKKLIDSIKREAIKNARKELGYMIMRDAHWISEDVKSKRLMGILGKNIHDHTDGIFEISKVRDEWREKIRGE